MSKIIAKDLNLWYGAFHALKHIHLDFDERRITAIIGPSGCGKSTLLRVFNRMNDLVEGVRMKGEVLIDDKSILDGGFNDLVKLRKKVGMVFQRPNPFPLSVYENVIFGLKVHHLAKKNDFDAIVQESLESVLLWNDLKDKLRKNALGLSLEQKQRLCIARTIAVKPDIVLMDEPCSALDPQATLKIEELMQRLKKEYTIVIVTHNMQQAARVSDHSAFFLMGELIEFGKTQDIFTKPVD
ncbi:MAG TPA: phosphate ABC transporter ATP-binding protein, partial [Candidatus Omnitrophica bacterium]|nr:phosphate ABC transporter ATP-binding protein [Candidatus Omnitrophota bacterium]